MKIVFLDIDGVLNHQEFYRAKRAAGTDKTSREIDDIDPSKVALLNKLHLETNCEFVISSTWRLGRTPEDLQKILDHHGFTGKVVDVTPRGKCGHRGCEIQEWLQHHRAFTGAWSSDYKEYVILDDDSDMLMWQMGNYINVDQEVGITNTTIYKAIRILTGVTPLMVVTY